MSLIKSVSVGNGDMFYINHGTSNFTIIDCCLCSDNKDKIIEEIETLSAGKNIIRFISTSMDNDHIRGLKELDDNLGLLNFYVVKNEAKKNDDNEDFKRYTSLMNSDKAYYISKGCKRKYMNESGEKTGSSGINILWPITDNKHFKEALQIAKDGGSPNNISPIFTYTLTDCVKVMWLGDLEFDFMEKIRNEIDFPEVDILFAPHHGRESGKIPTVLLEKMMPKLIVIGEAPSEFLNYYSPYNTITQNSAGDIIFNCYDNKVDVFASSKSYSIPHLTDNKLSNDHNAYYKGTLYTNR